MTNKILVLDYDVAMVNLLATVLETEGFTALKTQSANQALEVIEDDRPDLILLDVMMPEMDGFRFLAMVRSNPETHAIPVIILTPTDDPREVARCYELGCNVYITKPVDYEQFSEAMRKLGLFLMVVMIPDGASGEYGSF